MLRYAAIAALLALAAGALAFISQSEIVAFFAMLAMYLALVLAVALVVVGIGNTNRDYPRRGPGGPF